MVSPGGQEGLYRFLVDSAAPTGGGTDSGGFFAWAASQSDIPSHSSSDAVFSTVTNTVANQAHSIEADVGCADISGSGSCSASTGFSTLVISVYHP